MFNFQKSVDKAEARTLRLASGTLPYIEVSRKYGQKFFIAAFTITAIWLTAAWVIYSVSWYLSPVTLSLLGLWWLVSYGFVLNRFFRGYQTKALYQRLELRQKRGDVAALKERQEYAERAARDAERQALHNQQVEYQRAVYQMRLQLTRQVENGIKQSVSLYREELADEVWEPDGAAARGIYAEVRADMKAANVPEYGLLRETTDGLVGHVIGRDRSWLPPLMTDEQIAARHLPKPVAAAPTPAPQLAAKRKR